MAFKIPNFYAQNKQKAFAKGPEASTVPSPLNNQESSPLNVVGLISLVGLVGSALSRAKAKNQKAKEAKEETTKTPKTTEKKEKKETKGPDWSKAPKNNTQARRNWYKKNNLAQDASTKLKEVKATEPTKPAEKKVEKKVSTSNKAKIIEKNTKKVDKIETRGDKKVDRIKARQEKRKNRKANRAENKEARVAGRASRKEARQEKRAKVKEAKSGSPAEMKDPKYFGLGKDDGTGRKIKKANKTLKQISKMQNKRSSVKNVYLGDPDDLEGEKVRTADKPASKRETRKIKKYKKTKEQLGDKIAKSPLPIKKSKGAKAMGTIAPDNAITKRRKKGIAARKRLEEKNK